MNDHDVIVALVAFDALVILLFLAVTVALLNHHHDDRYKPR